MTTHLLHWSLGIACTLSFAGLHCSTDKTEPDRQNPMRSTSSTSTQPSSLNIAAATATDANLSNPDRIGLPPPDDNISMSLTEALRKRRSIRLFSSEGISLAELSAILWAGQGITADDRLRTAPSAGATYPLELYVTTRSVTGLPSGSVYHYNGREHTLVRVKDRDIAAELLKAALGQTVLVNAAANIVMMGIDERTAARYAERAQRYVDIETGHAAQNMLLQVTALGLAAVPVAAFQVDEVARILDVEGRPLYILPIGRPAAVESK